MGCHLHTVNADTNSKDNDGHVDGTITSACGWNTNAVMQKKLHSRDVCRHVGLAAARHR